MRGDRLAGGLSECRGAEIRQLTVLKLSGALDERFGLRIDAKTKTFLAGDNGGIVRHE